MKNLERCKNHTQQRDGFPNDWAARLSRWKPSIKRRPPVHRHAGGLVTWGVTSDKGPTAVDVNRGGQYPVDCPEQGPWGYRTGLRSNPSSFAFCRTSSSSSSRQRKLAVSAIVRPWASSFVRSLMSISDHGPEFASIGSVLSCCISAPCWCIAACIHSLANVSNLRRSATCRFDEVPQPGLSARAKEKPRRRWGQRGAFNGRFALEN